MSRTAAQSQYIADYIARAFGAMMVGLGAHAQIQPVEGARNFAGDIVKDEKDALFFPIVGGRNMAMGLAMLALSLQGERKAVGTILGCSVICGAVDVWFCLKHKSDKWTGHAIGSAIGIPLAWTLLQ